MLSRALVRAGAAGGSGGSGGGAHRSTGSCSFAAAASAERPC